MWIKVSCTSMLNVIWPIFHPAIISCLALKGEDLDDLQESSDAECRAAQASEESSREDEEDDEEEDTTASFEDCTSDVDWQTCSEGSGDEKDEEKCAASSACASFYNSSRLLRKDELLEMFKSAHTGPKCKNGQFTVGLVSLHLREFTHTHAEFIHFISMTRSYFCLRWVIRMLAKAPPSTPSLGIRKSRCQQHLDTQSTFRYVFTKMRLGKRLYHLTLVSCTLQHVLQGRFFTSEWRWWLYIMKYLFV